MRAYWQALPLQRRQYLARGIGIGALLLFPFVDLVCNWQLLNAVTDAAVFVVLALGLLGDEGLGAQGVDLGDGTNEGGLADAEAAGHDNLRRGATAVRGRVVH